ncbi:MAG: restriction endonuclease subunit S [Rickettsiales bacterium]|jgi:hypothetical protein|nr:restriction endonuclease subunit S [Rickettsiales bacterium]
MNNLKNWKEFTLSDLFSIKATSSGIDRSKLAPKIGNIPYITRMDKNNGWDGFVGKQHKGIMDKGNIISIGLDTQTAFYQPVDFFTGQNIQVLSNKHLNRYTAMFINPLLKDLMTKFNWGGNGATLTRLKRSKIILPTDALENPDWVGMEEYMKNIEQKLLRRYKNYLGNLESRRNVERERVPNLYGKNSE